jgi:hypothetical protein
MMSEFLRDLWFVDESGKKIITDVHDQYKEPDIVLVISRGSLEALTHICHIHNEWVEERWTDDAYNHALDKDD